MNSDSSQQPTSRIRWQGQIESVQCRAWVWRYIMHNRTHHHLGFNLFVKSEADGRAERLNVAISDTQQGRLQFHTGDVLKGTAWPCIKAKHDFADLCRASRAGRRRYPVPRSRRQTASALLLGGSFQQRMYLSAAGRACSIPSSSGSTASPACGPANRQWRLSTSSAK